MKWIKCKDELPERSGDYIHCFIGDDKSSVAFYNHESKEFCWHSMWEKADSTQCWMPLPKPIIK